MYRQGKTTTVLGTALLYTVIISISTFLRNISTVIPLQGGINNKIFWFLQRNTLWIIAIAAIIFVLGFYMKKSNQKICSIIADNPIIYLATGLLVVLEGISNFASSLPINILSVKSSIETRSLVEATQGIDVVLDGNIVLYAIIINSFSITITLCQILLGVLLIKVYKKKN